MKKVLHLLSGGSVGGIETLCLEIARLSEDEHTFCFLFEGGAILEEMKEEGYEVHPYYKKNPVLRLRNLIRLMYCKRYDAVLVHHEGIGIYAFYLILSILFSQPVFVKYLHCSFEDKYFYTGNKQRDMLHYGLLKKTIQRSDYLVAVSDYVKKSYCREFGCREEKIAVVYNGISAPRRRRNHNVSVKKEETLQLLYMGRLADVKGVDRLLEAMKLLIDQGEDMILDILGDGPQRGALEKLADSLGLSDRVYFRGFVMDKEVYWEKCRIFVYPSVCQEAFGISIIEAMAQGMVCVAAKVGGIPEIITDSVDGYLYQNDDENKNLSAAIKKAIDLCKSESYSDMVQRIQKRSDYFNIHETVIKLERICRGERR